MITNASIGQHQTRTVQPEIRASRIRALRILGGAQIGLGVVCVILGIVGVILSNTEMNSHCQTYNYYSSDYGYEYRYSYYECGNANAIIIMDLIGMAFSAWFILTGCFPLCMTEQRESSWKCLTVAFLVCNIISAVVFSSTVFSLALVGALIADFDTGGVVIVSALLAIFSFIEFIISIVAASHCCCCSQLNTENQQSVIYIHTAQSGMMHNIPNTPLPTGNQQGFHQIWKPEMQGYNGQQPANMPNNQQQAGHSQGNQIPIQGYYGQPPQQNINEQQLVHPPEAAAYMNQPVFY